MESNLVVEKHIDVIFKDLCTNGFIDTQSRYFDESKIRCLKTCSHFYPIQEFISNTEFDNETLLYTSYLFCWTYFLDEALDSIHNDSRIAKSTQISSYLLLKYQQWLFSNHENTIKLFNESFIKYSKYLIAEKKWTHPEYYLQEYGNTNSIIQKASICLFPLQYILAGKSSTQNIFKINELFNLYFTYLLLSDDITDLKEDIENRCLTYPIIIYYQIHSKLPQNEIEICEITKKRIFDELKYLRERIEAIKLECNWQLGYIFEKMNLLKH